LPVRIDVSISYTSAPGDHAPLVSSPSACRFSATIAVVAPVRATTILGPPASSIGDRVTLVEPRTRR
jgi:hypothetical protein